MKITALYTIIIYTISSCPYCVKAKQLLDKKSFKYTEINIENNPSLKEEMIQKTNGRRTVPQIFINGIHIGGCDDLHLLEKQGKLDDITAGT